MQRFRGAVAGCLSTLLVAGLTLASVESVAAAPAAASAAASGGSTSEPAEYIVVLKSSANAAKAMARHQKAGAQIGHHYSSALKGYSGTLPPGLAKKLQGDTDVLFVTPSRKFRRPPNPHVVKRAADFAGQLVARAIQRIDAPESSTQSGDGTGTVDVDVAVIDTGVDPRQLELHVAGGHNCVGNNRNDWADKEGHGTAVAGLIAAFDDNTGWVGVAPGARIWALRVFEGGEEGSDSDLICALDWVAATHLDRDPQNDIEVVNMSLTGESEHGPDDGNCGRTNGDPIHLAICRVAELGVTPVAAAGNDTADATNLFPAGYDEVLTATAMADYDGLPGSQVPAQCRLLDGTLLFDDGADFGQVDDGAAWFSNWVSLPEDQAHTVSAPGVCVQTIAPRKLCGTRYPACFTIVNGTSFASPITAGVVALCIASGPCAGLTPAQIITKIVADARAYNVAHPNYGFRGDPQHPIAGKYYGDLVRAALY
jgi:subtilisin family serine protease